MTEQELLRERLAELAHEQWAGWMRHLFDKCHTNRDGTITMPEWAARRWQRLARAGYAELSEGEKDSDRAEADRVLVILEETTHG